MTTSTLLAQDKSVVVPGQVLAEGLEFLPGNGTYRLGDNVLARQLGILQIAGKVLKTTPLSGKYLPANNDIVIGKVVDILMSGWRIEINSPYVAMLPLSEASFDFIRKGADLTEYFDLGDYLLCKITQVTSQNLIDISMKSQGLKKLKGGHFVTVNAAKVPRIIGRRGSMATLLKHATGCEIHVGQNGIVWISGEPEMEVLAVNAIRKIDENAHISGLTEQIKQFLEQATGKSIDLDAIQQEAERAHEESLARQERPRFGGNRDGPRGDGPRDGPRDFSRGGDGPRGDGPRDGNRGGFRDNNRRGDGRGFDRNRGNREGSRGDGPRDAPRNCPSEDSFAGGSQ